jgi:cobyrinic acid a,c-diamide synthase
MTGFLIAGASSGVEKTTATLAITAAGFGVSGTNVLASYIHLHFRANPIVTGYFTAAAIAAVWPCMTS